MIQLVVFDLDGTLVDSRRDLADAANATLTSFGADALPEERIWRMVGEGAPVLVARAFEAAGAPQPAGAFDRFLSIYHRGLLQHTRPYDGIVDVLDDLTPRVALAVLTNKPLDATRSILDGLDLSRFFPAARVVAGDGPFARKPDPSGLQHLMGVSGAASEGTLMVGDSIIDWRTSRAAATRVCLARYGFGWESVSGQLPASVDAWWIDQPRELLQYV